MIKVIGVRFRTAGKIYFFDPVQFDIKRGDHVIVETARGIEFGTVVSGVKEVEEDKVIQPLKPVIRIANQRDIEQEAGNKVKEKEAYKICLEKIRKHGLEMKLIDAEYTFDNNKVLFYFTADGRIDFRELVKDLASVFKTRIELRQIGVRDETKIMGGIGICGRPLCCHSYLSDFVPVSIKMAKEQNLSLNPTKISGVCGRLMCCLKNEEETYEELNSKLPGIGDLVTTEDGLKGEVQSVNVLRQLVKVLVSIGDEKEIREYEVEKLSFKRRKGKKDKVDLSQEELQELERLEDEEIQEIQEAAENRQENNQRRDNRENRKQDGAENQNQRRENYQRRGNRDGQQREPKEYQPRENRDGQQRENKEYQPRENRDGQQRENKEYQPRENRDGQQREPKEYQPRENRDGQQRENKEYQPRENRDGQQRENKEYQRRENRDGQQRENKEYQPRENQSREYRQRREGQENRPRREYRQRQENGRKPDFKKQEFRKPEFRKPEFSEENQKAENRDGQQRENKDYLPRENQSREYRQRRDNRYKSHQNPRQQRQEGKPEANDSQA